MCTELHSLRSFRAAPEERGEMAATSGIWEPTNHSAWADVLGLVPVPLFGHKGQPERHGTYTVLLDGQKASFAICSTRNAKLSEAEAPRSWSWSANLRHVLVVDEKRGEMALRRWDRSGARRFRLPRDQEGAAQLLGILEDAPAPMGVDVVPHVLRAFQCLRAILPATDAVAAVSIFNALLVGTAATMRKELNANSWSSCKTIGDALDMAGERRLMGVELQGIGQSHRSASLGPLLDLFLEPEPVSGLNLDPDLLLRHAAGQLYQEAHLLIERDQLLLPGIGVDTRSQLASRKDARFTPTPLARLLVQQAIDGLAEHIRTNGVLRVVDPACGSGVFLLETLRELELRGYRGKVEILGMDISAVSRTMAEFCLAQAKQDANRAGMDVDYDLKETDALCADWRAPHLVLMNPPFASWVTMSMAERDEVAGILGSLAGGRVDKAMAFVWKAVDQVASGGVVASVLPATVLETRAGEKWREALLTDSSVSLIGHFTGYTYFRGSTVEPGFVVLKRAANGLVQRSRPTMLLASEGAEDAAIRGLRRVGKVPCPIAQEGWELYEAWREGSEAGTWLPRPRRDREMIEVLAGNRMTRVAELFDVRQGAKTGLDKVFVLQRGDYASLPARERRLFRPAASSSTIREGRLQVEEFVFFPYDKDGLTLRSEEELSSQMTTYYQRFLLPARDTLSARPRISPDQWWVLYWERAWQYDAAPKLVSKSFGEAGSFAYDEKGEFAVVQGLAWMWKEDCGDPSFHETGLPWAYLALLNSVVFETLLAHYCPRIRGGQFDLLPKYVNQVFMPNLGDELSISADAVQELAMAGRHIHSGKWPDEEWLREAAAKAYGLSLEYVPQRSTGYARS
jgi:adenine-specific DNA-methyltransferase